MALAPVVFAEATDSDTTTLSVTVAAESTITVTVSPTLAKGTTEFESYTGSTTFTYRIRTTESSGAGTVTALVTTPFDAASNIKTADLTHVVAKVGGAVGTANTNSTTASEQTATNILTFGAGAHSSDSNDSATINWTLADRPAYKTGTYSATVTLTISVT